MYRFILCLPLCLVQNGGRPESPPSENGITTGFVSNDPLPVKDSLAFLEKCLERYEEQGIKGYRCTFQKQERIDGKLMPSEETEVYYREKPYSVYMHWLRGQRRADSVIYVEGENDDKMLVHPAGVAGALVKVVTRDVDGPDAKQAGRYTLKQLGMKQGMERSLKDWKAARDRGDLHVDYLGVRKVHETGDRLCYTLRRTSEKPEEDGILERTIYIDKELWLQTGVVLKGEDNKLVGEYMYRDIEINPTFKPDQFKREALSK